MKSSKLVSKFAILDIQHGQAGLTEHFLQGAPRSGPCPVEMRVPVIITGYIDGINGASDGISREFTMTVEKVEVLP